MQTDLVAQLLQLVEDFKTYHESSERVVNHAKPKELQESFQLNLKNAHSQDDLKKLATEFMNYSVKTGHKQYFNQLFSGFTSPAVLGDVLSVLMNASMYTFEVAPIATLIEMEVIRKMNEYTGFTDGDGIFTSGGSNSNMVAMLCAKQAKFPKLKEEGFFGQAPITAFVSDQCHYSFEKSAFTLGMGTKHLYKVKSDEYGEMIPEELEKAVEASKAKGERPFFIAATAATTEIGGFDPIDKMNDVAKKHNCWLHVDGSWGGSILLCPKYHYLFKGLSKADSFAWNAHKLMNVPLISSALLLKDKTVLHNATCSQKTDYIFHDNEYTNFDLGKKSLQCGRRNDALKVWMAWKSIGDDGYAQRIDNLMSLAKYCVNKIENHPDLDLLKPTKSLNINFRYKAQDVNDLDQINDMNLAIRQKMMEKGNSMVNYVHLGDDISIRLVLVNHELNEQDMDEFFDNFISTAKEVASEMLV